ncbi:MAG: bifunctional 2-polyprenyl-6-hydroxyphenol methylase/3-demethylubiquinol 3-O-methyltransferase UbiG [Alphaproteobacteria bacterium]
MTHSPSIDPAEVARFSAQAAHWWDPNGPFRPLHKFNPARLGYIRDQICTYFRQDPHGPTPLNGLRLLDIGCGGGLVCEPMARLGATIVGADASYENIGAASAHARQQGLRIDYRHASAETLAEAGEQFDIVLNLEVIEHVADRSAFLAACAQLLKPGGLMILATLNRTLKAYGLAVVGAEYVLGWLPRGTHDWNKFITPEELSALLAAQRLNVTARTGVSYQILTGHWALSPDLDVNYMLCAVKPG